MRSSERALQALIFFSRWLIVPFVVGMLCCLLLLIYRFFADLYELAIHVPGQPWHDLIAGVLNLIDITLVANLILIVVYSAYENYIHKTTVAEYPDWPSGLRNVEFGTLKQKLLASIAGIAAVDALAWYLDLDKYSDTSKLAWAIAFPLMFVLAMVLLATADWLARHTSGGPE